VREKARKEEELEKFFNEFSPLILAKNERKELSSE
jgi:hypothetical protein